MKTLDEIKEVLQSHKDDLQVKYHVKKLSIFGSFARGEQGIESDVDILVEFDEPIG